MAGSMRTALRALTSASVHTPLTAVAARPPLLGLVCPLAPISRWGCKPPCLQPNHQQLSNLPRVFTRFTGRAAKQRAGD